MRLTVNMIRITKIYRALYEPCSGYALCATLGSSSTGKVSSIPMEQAGGALLMGKAAQRAEKIEAPSRFP